MAIEIKIWETASFGNDRNWGFELHGIIINGTKSIRIKRSITSGDCYVKLPYPKHQSKAIPIQSKYIEPHTLDEIPQWRIGAEQEIRTELLERAEKGMAIEIVENDEIKEFEPPKFLIRAVNQNMVTGKINKRQVKNEIQFSFSPNSFNSLNDVVPEIRFQKATIINTNKLKYSDFEQL